MRLRRWQEAETRDRHVHPFYFCQVSILLLRTALAGLCTAEAVIWFTRINGDSSLPLPSTFSFGTFNAPLRESYSASKKPKNPKNLKTPPPSSDLPPPDSVHLPAPARFYLFCFILLPNIKRLFRYSPFHKAIQIFFEQNWNIADKKL